VEACDFFSVSMYLQKESQLRSASLKDVLHVDRVVVYVVWTCGQ